MQLCQVVKKLELFAANTLAAKWDNVGLLLEPSAPHTVSRILLTNDLTEPVLDEAILLNTDFIVAYHPPIFVPMRRLTQSSWKERLLVKCIENRIAIFSPHTTYDTLKGGVNDWLILPFRGVVTPLEIAISSKYPGTSGGYRLQVTVPEGQVGQFMSKFSGQNHLQGVSVIMQIAVGMEGSKCSRVCLNCDEKSLTQVVAYVNQFEQISNTMEILPMAKAPMPGYGEGRRCALERAVSVMTAVNMMKTHLGLSHVRLALALGATLESNIKSVAVCAGSGSSVLKDVVADLYVTGEMGHHDVIHATQRGTTVILCEHSNSERGYLTVLCTKLQNLFGSQVTITQSKVDADPLVIV